MGLAFRLNYEIYSAVRLKPRLRDATRRFLVQLAAALCCTCSLLGAGTVPSLSSSYLVKVWGQEDGLPHYSVPALSQTPDGYLWVGTFGGLCRFDGDRFVVVSPETTPGMPGNYVVRAFTDHAGALWISTDSGGGRYAEGSWTPFKQPQGWPNQLVRCFAEDREGRIIISTASRILRLEGGHFNELPAPPEAAPEQAMLCAVDDQDTLFAAHDSFCGYLDHDKWVTVLSPSDLRDATFCGIASSKTGGIWIAEAGRIRKWQAGQWGRTIPRVAPFQRDFVTMVEDSDGTLWTGGFVQGVSVYRSDGSSAKCTSEEGLENNSTMSLLLDREGNVWAGSNGGGLARLKRRAVMVYDEKAGLPQNVVNSVLELEPGKLLVATHGAGLVHFDDGKVGSPIAGLGGATGGQSWVHSVVRDISGTIWAGTYLGGLYRIRGEEVQQIPFDKIGAQIVNQLYAAKDGRLWIGTVAGLASEYQGQFEVLDDAAGVPHMVVSGIAETSDGQIYVGGSGTGLFKRNGQRFTRAVFADVGEPSDPHSAYGDREGDLWVGTDAHILWRLHAGNAIAYTEANALPVHTINSIIEDNAGDIWLGTPSGIVRITRSSLDAVLTDPAALIDATVLDRSDGLRTMTCRDSFQPTICRGADGRLWFATLKGLAVADPRTVLKKPPPPQARVEEVLAEGKPLPGPALGEASVPRGTRRLQIRVGAVCLSAPEKLIFQHQLEGLDRDWVNAGNSRVAYLNDLRPGNYVFRVRASSSDLIWGPETTFHLRVLYYFWQTAWFQTLASLGICGTLGAAGWRLHTARLSRQRERLEQEKALAEERANSAALLRAKEAADMANQAKSEFLATISHEIRTPMNGVLGFTDLLLETKLDQQQKEYAGTIRHSADGLLAIINDILDFSKIEAGKLAIQVAPFDLRQTLIQATEVLAARAEEKQLELVLHLDPNLPTCVIGDSARIRQVVLNLLGNAVKFTLEGHVLLRAQAQSLPQKPDRCELKVSVTDTGIGIPKEVQASLFQKFTQVDSSTTRRFGGTGLGLAISKRLVEMMGGVIGLESDQGAGATFWFTLPLPTETIESEPVELPPGLAGARILLVEDLECSARALTSVLEKWGLAAEAAPSPELALIKLRGAAASGKPYRIVIIDYTLAHIHGDALGRFIRGDSELAKTALILTLPAILRGEIQRFAPHGFCAFVIKPILRDTELLRALDAASGWLENPDGRVAIVAGAWEEAPEREPQPLPEPRYRVLLVEDNPVNQILATEVLRRLACRVDPASDGAEGVHLAKRSLYDFILMDCQMPGMDGFEATAAIRHFGEPRGHTPIIAVTASAIPGDRAKCIAAGMDDYIAKPYRAADLERIINQWASAKEHTAQT